MSGLYEACVERVNLLRQTQAAATPGPWRSSESVSGEVWADRDASGWDAHLIATTATRLNGPDSANTAFIATFDPVFIGGVLGWAEDVLDRHSPSWSDFDPEPHCDVIGCAENEDWPCVEVRSVATALGVSEPQPKP
jgi:hypothetical protein